MVNTIRDKQVQEGSRKRSDSGRDVDRPCDLNREWWRPIRAMPRALLLAPHKDEGSRQEEREKRQNMAARDSAH